MPFRFRQFVVEDKKSTMRVGTDSMLLGAWTEPGAALRILDVGTGCGVLAMMMAQKSTAVIDAIDIDLPSVAEASFNFSHSPWNTRLNAIHSAFGQFIPGIEPCYDLIISNPPYFNNSLRSPVARKNNTRHEDGLSLGELIENVARLLAFSGRFCVILPSDQADKCCHLCESAGLFATRSLVVYPRPGAPARRVLLDLSGTGSGEWSNSELTILDSSGKFSDKYLSLTHSFHHF